MNIVEIVNHLVKQTETIVTVAIQQIKAHVYSVKVNNFPKTYNVKGTVIVGNQKNLETEIKSLKTVFEKKLLEIKNSIPQIVIPKEIRVSNIKDTPLPKEIKIPDYPKEITVKNPVKEVSVSNLEEVVDSVKKLLEAIKKIKLDPKITVSPPEVKVETKAPIVNIPKQEKLFSDNPKNYVPVRLTDGEKFYKALEELVLSSGRLMFSDESGKKSQALIDSDRHVQVDIRNGNMLTSYETNEVDKVSSTLTYNGLEDQDGKWCIQRINSESGVSVRFATVINNEEYETFQEAWNDRSSLTYGYFSEAF